MKNKLDFWQGDVESIASKNPKELTGLIEQISGSDELKRDYDDLSEQVSAAQAKSALVYSEKRNVVAERKQKKAQKEEAEKHLALQEELVSHWPYFYHLTILLCDYSANDVWLLCFTFESAESYED